MNFIAAHSHIRCDLEFELHPELSVIGIPHDESAARWHMEDSLKNSCLIRGHSKGKTVIYFKKYKRNYFTVVRDSWFRGAQYELGSCRSDRFPA